MAFIQNLGTGKENPGARENPEEEKVPTEEELQKGLQMLEMYKNQIEAYSREAERLMGSLQDHSRALETLYALKKMEKPTEMVIPIGAGIFIHVKPMSTSKTIMRLGVGISAEYEVKNALEKVEGSIREMEEREKKVVSELRTIERTAEALSQQLQAQYEKMQAAKK